MKHLRIGLLATGVLAAVATSKAPIDTAGDSDTDDTDDTASECAQLSVEDCALDESCATIDGRLLQDDGDGGLCVDFSEDGEPQGCMLADLGCGEAETLAAPSADSDQCWWFSNTCIPEGWVSCDQSTADECVD